MRPSTVLEMNRPLIRATATRFRAANPRTFWATQDGSTLNGAGLDLVVDALPGATAVDLGGLQEELEARLRVPVTVWTPADLPGGLRDELLADARPV
jgi:predicted nucleotidyltransferase